MEGHNGEKGNACSKLQEGCASGGPFIISAGMLGELRALCRELTDQEFTDKDLHVIAERMLRFAANADSFPWEF